MYKQPPRESNESTNYIIGFIVIVFFILLAYENGRRYPENPRYTIGRYQVVTEDSVYLLKFTIDSAYEKEADDTPPERN